MIILIGIVVVFEVREKELHDLDEKVKCVHEKRGYCRQTHEPCRICALFKTKEEQESHVQQN